ncbi:hypothetical protein PENSUB_1459 [Penicillium subrubescens]|uniref:Uncharacterized protein n=1 Tax=Penicillium subrubescens TaxID=1316194 RepID=A0A1Q5UK94_9EURO|nr:hypothetical protein PENSUB_1459 [Penicillium subrubescens]
MSAQRPRECIFEDPSKASTTMYSQLNKPLPPKPLNFRKPKVKKEGFFVSSSAMISQWTPTYSRPGDEEINKDLKNKPLPPDPPDPDLVAPNLPDSPALLDEIVGNMEHAARMDDMNQMSLLLPERSPGPFDIPSDQVDFDKARQCVWSPKEVDIGYVAGKIHPLACTVKAQLWEGQHHNAEREKIMPVQAQSGGKSDRGSGDLEINIRRPLAFNRPSSQFLRTAEALGRGLLSTFFGFEGHLDALNGRQLERVRYLLANQPRPEDVIDKDIYPNSCCVWLRNFIVAFIRKLNFDHSRRTGLTDLHGNLHGVHRGFGLLWGFLDACGPTVVLTGVTKGGNALNEFQWFQVGTLPCF